MESSRLRLRRLTISDLDNMQSLEGDSEVTRYIPLRNPISREKSLERLQGWIHKEAERAPLGIWAVETKASSQFVGWIMLLQTTYDVPELGYMIVRQHWGQGYATEAARRLIAYAFNELKYPALVAGIDIGHGSSKQVLLKLGFTYWKDKTQLDPVLDKDVLINVYRLENFACNRRL